ncbi:MAG: hypothetical protein M1835_000327 [Candelina submexicana]|nr:MAG: hypothetical protein M1835_000327 [Candelina submexicana]
MASSSLPSNVHVSQHPCLRAKLSQLRSQETKAKETKALIHELTLILGCEALAKGLKVTEGGTDKSPIGYDYSTETISTSSISLVPILRSGLGMIEGSLLPLRHETCSLTLITTALQILLPIPVSVHHLGLFREPITLQPVEYYNNLPYHQAPAHQNSAAAEIAILLDPVIATGGTSQAAIQTLREWGVKKVIVISILGSIGGVRRMAEEWPENVEVWIGGIDAECDARGMIKPGLGDVGDRLFLTIGK